MDHLPAHAGPGALLSKDDNRSQLLTEGCRGALRTPAGSIAALFTLLSYDRKARIAVYTLRLLNGSVNEVACVVFGLTHDGTPALVHPEPIHVAPNSKLDTEISVRVEGFGSFERVLAEVRSASGIFRIEAPPYPKFQSKVPKIIAAATSGVALLVAGAFGFMASVPRVSGFSLPPKAMVGTTVEAEYSASGIGRVAYSVEDPDGKAIAGGPLQYRTGTVRFAIPASHDGAAYTMRLSMIGPLGRNAETRVVNAIPLPKPRLLSGANIASIEIDPIVAHPGDLVHVMYASNGDEGFLRMLDQHGTIWAQIPSSKSGNSWMRVPLFDRDREMRVSLNIKRGPSSAQSSAGMIVIASKGAIGEDLAAKKDTGAENAIFKIAKTNVKSGGTVKIKVLTPRPGLRIALADTQSHEIDGMNVGFDQPWVYLRAPDVQLAQRYVIVASFTDGFGQESVVAPLIVAP